MNRLGTTFIAIAAAGLLAAPDARAQAPSGPSRSGPSPLGSHLKPAQRGGAGSAADQPVSLMGQVQLVLDRLEDELRIGAHQQKAWDLYAARVLKFAEDLTRARFSARDMQDGGLSVPQQFDRLAEIASNRLTAVEEIIDAGRAVYETLGPDQRKLADRELVIPPLRLLSGSAAATAVRAEDLAIPDASPRKQ
jgi:hypothetical protein